MEFEKAKNILNYNNKKESYTDQEIQEILILLENFKLVFINKYIKNKQNEKCNHLRKSIN